jgi:hypothetical protein
MFDDGFVSEGLGSNFPLLQLAATAFSTPIRHPG